MTITYWKILLMVSLAFALAERLRPWRSQAVRRRGLFTDLIYLVFNGHFLALLLAPLIGVVAPQMERLIVPILGRSYLDGWPMWGQYVLGFFLIDFIQWGIHVLMHRVPDLWRIHRVHHSIQDMDWLGSMRFHWLEIVVYRSLQYLPFLLLGFDWQVLAWHGLFATIMGHFNHANLKADMGPLRYLLNHPGMHIWHHDAAAHGRYGCNFGINLSLWDWLFGTAYLPDDIEQPVKLGFAGLSRFPRGFLAQQAVPFWRRNEVVPRGANSEDGKETPRQKLWVKLGSGLGRFSGE